MQKGLSELIIDGEAAKREILLSIHEAQHSIRIRMFMWRDDEVGNMILQALYRKSQLFPSVDIWIEKDIFGSLVYNLQYLLSLGKIKGDIFSVKNYHALVQNKKNIRFRYVGGWFSLRGIYLKDNDHSKIFLFDELSPSQTALVGGMNIANQYLSHTIEDGISTGWHDYMVKISGFSVDDIGKFGGINSRKGIQHKLLAGIEIFKTLHDRRAMRRRIIRELSLAQSSIIIEHAYFTDMKIIRKLRRLSQKGIEIRVIFSDTSDGVWHANMHSAYRLLQPIQPSFRHMSKEKQLQVFIYPGMLHAKVILIDEKMAIIGSANLTHGSFRFFYETNVIIREDGESIRSLREQLAKDISEGRDISLETLPKYSYFLAWIEKWFI